jgi:3-oxoacyl-[acyl-carrier-protein] synthase-3
MNIKITGTGSSLPKLRITNEDLSRIVDTSDEWIASRTGIRARHIAVEETTTEMSVEAAESALKSAGIEAEDVGIIIAATVSADKYLPGLACEVQKNIGAKHAVAFDLNAACSGFLFALNTAALYLKQGIYQHALIIGAETLSKMVDWTDRSTCVLFGDGAGAAVLSVSEEKGILSMVQGSDGARGDVLSCEARKVNNPYKKSDTALSYVSMNGQEVYRFAVKTVPKAICESVERAGLKLEDIDLFLLHQANYRIIEAVSKRLGQPMKKFPTNLEECGNISAASVPILLDNVNNHGMMTKGMKIVLAGFGAGLTWGAVVIEW